MREKVVGHHANENSTLDYIAKITNKENLNADAEVKSDEEDAKSPVEVKITNTDGVLSDVVEEAPSSAA